MGGDDLNRGEKMKCGEEPPSPGLCPKGAASRSPDPTPGLGARSCHCSLGMSQDKNSIQAFMFPGNPNKVPVAANIVPISPTHALYGSIYSQSLPEGIQYGPSHFLLGYHVPPSWSQLLQA